MGASMQMDSRVLEAVADVVPQDVLMVDNDSKTFLFLRLQGLTAIKKRTKKMLNFFFWTNFIKKPLKKMNNNDSFYIYFVFNKLH